ncbi:unnamed protein product [Urochloa decumbens]|uniref:Auxin-responsive protein n=1 Tax=Urochloa decumbens TaxID=240449 RepID=A0ABC9DW63_9POAL
MELELGLAPPSGGLFVGRLDGAAAAGACGKRVFGEAFRAEKATLPLFVREEDGGGDDGDSDGVDGETSNKRRRLVGWPPVKCAHRRSCVAGGGGYVKVNMEGVAIGRKVDVSLHGSYEELLRTLAGMFPPPSADTGAGGAIAEEAAPAATRHERGRGHRLYVVTYEDGEGDWLLVGDVPWDAFAKSVKRLKILA